MSATSATASRSSTPDIPPDDNTPPIQEPEPLGNVPSSPASRKDVGDLIRISERLYAFYELLGNRYLHLSVNQTSV